MIKNAFSTPVFIINETETCIQNLKYQIDMFVIVSIQFAMFACEIEKPKNLATIMYKYVCVPASVPWHEK